MPRPYIQLPIDKIEILAKRHWNSADELKKISVELEHRKTRAARKLKEHIIVHMSEINGKAPKSILVQQTVDKFDPQKDIMKYDQLVVDVIKQYQNNNFAKEDLMQEGRAGLLEAGKNFTGDTESSFKNFAKIKIKKCIEDFISFNSELETIKTIVNNDPQIMNREISSPLESVIKKNQYEQTSRLLSTLTPREERVLRMRFGIYKKEDQPLEEVGQDFEVTRERIRLIEAKEQRKLRNINRRGK